MEEIVEKDMTPRLIKELGMRYPTEKSRNRISFGLFECQYCGKEFVTSISSTRRRKGGTRSCGCLVKKNLTTHGLGYHRFFFKWNAMKSRCYNSKDKQYEEYGGRGITICEEWLNIKNFISWCEATYPNIEGISLDRIDNDKGYSPENCRWADKTTQAINQRMHRNNTSGYVGIHWNKDKKKWSVRIAFKKERVHIGLYLTIEEAVLARDNYIIENKLPHKLSTDY